MSRLVLSVAALLCLGTACKKDPLKTEDTAQGQVEEDIDHCAVYVEARAACISAYGGNPADYGLDAASWCADDDGSQDDTYDCHTAAWEAGDCETVEGYNAALSASEECGQIE
jgi:hypothetical protein